MSAHKHTPGPWIIDHATRGYEVCTIHQLPPNETGQAWAYIYPSSYHWAEPEEQLANAHLIAAAPDLLEALREIIEYRGGAVTVLHDYYVMDRVHAAIAKAEGRT